MDPRVAQIAAHQRHLADHELDGYCDLYARLARAIADDEELLTRLAAQPGPALTLPVLFFAAVHDLVLAEPDLALARWYGDDPPPRSLGDPWPAFRALVDERFDQLAATMAGRVVQTNEVGRSAPLVLALGVLAGELGRPLALVEIGASAGLNLLLDRFSYSFPPAQPGPVGAVGSPVHLRCEGRGPVDPPAVDPADLALASRVGIDPRPLDVTAEDDRRWLAACLWPGIADRAEHLRAALELARADPPELRRGSALDLLGPALDEVPDDVVPCVVSTWVLAYLDADERRAVHRLLAERSRHRDLACVTAEYQGIAPWVPPVDDRDAPRATILAVTTWTGGREVTRPVARIQPHGRWIEWLPPGGDPVGHRPKTPTGGSTPGPDRPKET